MGREGFLGFGVREEFNWLVLGLLEGVIDIWLVFFF